MASKDPLFVVNAHDDQGRELQFEVRKSDDAFQSRDVRREKVYASFGDAPASVIPLLAERIAEYVKQHYTEVGYPRVEGFGRGGMCRVYVIGGVARE